LMLLFKMSPIRGSNFLIEQAGGIAIFLEYGSQRGRFIMPPQSVQSRGGRCPSVVLKPNQIFYQRIDQRSISSWRAKNRKDPRELFWSHPGWYRMQVRLPWKKGQCLESPVVAFEIDNPWGTPNQGLQLTVRQGKTQKKGDRKILSFEFLVKNLSNRKIRFHYYEDLTRIRSYFKTFYRTQRGSIDLLHNPDQKRQLDLRKVSLEPGKIHTIQVQAEYDEKKGLAFSSTGAEQFKAFLIQMHFWPQEGERKVMQQPLLLFSNWVKLDLEAEE